MHKIKLEVNGYERWLTHLHYEYFHPVESNAQYYRKFLQKNFPFELTDSTDLYPYSHLLPRVKAGVLDRHLQQECHDKVTAEHYWAPFIFDHDLSETMDKDNVKDHYYNCLGRARHEKGLDDGIAPNFSGNYDRYLRPMERPTARVEHNRMGGLLNITLNSSERDEFLYEWLLSGEMQQGRIVMTDEDGNPLFKIEFWDCFCVGIQEHMSAHSSHNMQMQLRLSPGITRNRSVEDLKPWKVTDLSQAAAPSVVPPASPQTKDERPDITQLYWTDMKGQRKNDPLKGKNYLVVHSNNSIGKKATFNLANPIYNFRYEGTELVDDLLEGYTIKASRDRIELEAF